MGCATCASAVPFSLSAFFLASTHLCFWTGGVLSHQHSSTHRFSRYLLGSLYFLVTFAVLSLSCFCCNRQSLLLNSYLLKIGEIENFLCACGHPTQDAFHVILLHFTTYSLPRSLFGDSFSLHNLWFRPWQVVRLLNLHGHPPRPHLLEGVG